MQPQEPSMRSMTQLHEGSTKLDKSKELNANMSVEDLAQDDYTRKIFHIGGK